MNKKVFILMKEQIEENSYPDENGDYGTSIYDFPYLVFEKREDAKNMVNIYCQTGIAT